MYRPLRPAKPNINGPSRDAINKALGISGKGPVWVGGFIGNVPQSAVSPSPTPTTTTTPTVTPTPSITPTTTVTPTTTTTPTVTTTPTNTPTTSVTPSITPTNTPTPSSSPIPSGTTQANTYLTAVTNNGGTGLTETMSAATRTLFTSLVSNGFYDNMIAMYPLIGGVANSSKLNAVNVGTYDITWAGGLVFTVTGATGNGTNSYGDTGFAFSANPEVYSAGTIGVYTNGQPTASATAFGGGTGNVGTSRFMIFDFAFDAGDSSFEGRVAPVGYAPLRSGLYIGTTSGTSRNKLLISRTTGTTIHSGTTNPQKVTQPNSTLQIFRRANNSGYFNQPISFAFLYNGGLTDSEMTTLSSIITTYQSSLGRRT
jgi:hypothetical protein